MVVDGEGGRSLFKVNVRNGEGHDDRARQPVGLGLVAGPRRQAGGARRAERRHACVSTVARPGDRWKKYYQVRLRELKEQNEYEPLGASDQPGKFYVLARPEGAQRRGVYLYDLDNESFGPPIAENPEFDIVSAFVSRDGKGVQRYCYLAHVRICESADAKLNAHIKGVRKYFKDSANVYVIDASDDNQVLLLFVEGPSDPPAYYQYRTEQKEHRSSSAWCSRS